MLVAPFAALNQPGTLRGVSHLAPGHWPKGKPPDGDPAAPVRGAEDSAVSRRDLLRCPQSVPSTNRVIAPSANRGGIVTGE
jgi:hypothetical protein